MSTGVKETNSKGVGKKKKEKKKREKSITMREKGSGGDIFSQMRDIILQRKTVHTLYIDIYIYLYRNE